MFTTLCTRTNEKKLCSDA